MPCERAELRRRLAEALDLELCEGGIRLGGREVAHDADDLTRRCGDLGESPAAHPGIDLEMDLHPLRDPAVRRDELEPRDASFADFALGDGPHDDDAGVAKRRAQVEGLGQRRDAERGRTGVERRLRDVDRAVAVALGLDDGPQLGSPRRAEQRLGVPPDRAEIEGEAGPLHAAILYWICVSQEALNVSVPRRRCRRQCWTP